MCVCVCLRLFDIWFHQTLPYFCPFAAPSPSASPAATTAASVHFLTSMFIFNDLRFSGNLRKNMWRNLSVCLCQCTSVCACVWKVASVCVRACVCAQLQQFRFLFWNVYPAHSPTTLSSFPSAAALSASLSPTLPLPYAFPSPVSFFPLPHTLYALRAWCQPEIYQGN